MDGNLKNSWGVFLEEMNGHLSGSAEFNQWFKPLTPVEMTNNTLTVRLPSQEYYNQIEDVYIDLVKESLQKAFGTGINLKYQIPTEITKRPRRGQTFEELGNRAGTSTQKASGKFETHLDHRMSFDNFYQSICNRLACTAAASIVDKPGENAFNPLFVYGASGVGKTHLIHAIGNELTRLRPGYRAVYVPAQTFKRQYVEATITHRNPELFFNYYQNIDLLLIDDIQEFSEAISTQNAFFQIFNNLKLLGKQIIITSDRAPVDLKGMEDRLYTRLKWGLTVEIERPDVHLRKDILTAKVDEAGIELPDDVFKFIVKHCKDNVRDLEGGLTSLLAHSIYGNVPIDLQLAEKVLSQTVGVEERKINVPEILDLVCKYYNLDKSDVISRKRKREIVTARQVVMYLSKELTDASLAAIGADLGGRDHSTVIYGANAVIDLMETNSRFREEIGEIQELLNL